VLPDDPCQDDYRNMVRSTDEEERRERPLRIFDGHFSWSMFRRAGSEILAT
jgi:hypothetical protein